jgi:hypothetical protein
MCRFLRYALKIDRCLTILYYHTMTKTDAITMMKNSAMWKDITLNFKDWNEMSRNKNDDDANDKLHTLVDDAIVDIDIDFAKIVVNAYGIIDIMMDYENNYGCVMDCLKNRTEEQRYRFLLYNAVYDELCEVFNEELEDKEYSDSEEEIEIESLDSFLRREGQKIEIVWEESDEEL